MAAVARKRNIPEADAVIDGIEDVSPRKLRRAKERRVYSEDLVDHDANNYIDGQRCFDIQEKVTCDDKYDASFVQPMKGSDFTVDFFQGGKFDRPLIFHSKNGLGLKMPDAEFDVGDVKTLVGAGRQVDVMDTVTQKGSTMPLWQFTRYYEDEAKRRDVILNVISLEFSCTKLAPIVEGPQVIRQLDWVDTAWPSDLKASHKDATNNLATMKYPKVQKYCLMSVRGCYTDFHVDFGGTSVWYHIHRGSKIFWLIPPTEGNLLEFERWTLSGFQDRSFFADRVKSCQRIQLMAGNTFMIPTGWIHAVYTPSDSLVFGGNFLHSYSIMNQLRISQLEVAMRVPIKFRYPFFYQMHWFVLERYVTICTGISHLFSAHRKTKKKKKSKPNDDDDDDSFDSGPKSTLPTIDSDARRKGGTDSGRKDSVSEAKSEMKSFSNPPPSSNAAPTASAPTPTSSSCDKTKTKKNKKLSIFSFWESQVLVGPNQPETDLRPIESPTFSPTVSSFSSTLSIKAEPDAIVDNASSTATSTSTTSTPLPPKMVIAIDHSYAKNWEDLAFSPWNPAAAATAVTASSVAAEATVKTEKKVDASESLPGDRHSSISKNDAVTSNGVEAKTKWNGVDAVDEPAYLKPIVADDMKDVVLNGSHAVATDGASSDVQKEKKKKKKKTKLKSGWTSSALPVFARLEIEGIRRLVEVLDNDPPQDVPEAIGSRAGSLLKAGRKLVADLEAELKGDRDEDRRGVTGNPILTRFE